MIKPKLFLIHSYDVSPEVEISPSAYVRSGHMYLTNSDPSLVNYLRSVREAEKQMNEWIRKYQNVLDGLNYWKAKALEKL